MQESDDRVMEWLESLERIEQQLAESLGNLPVVTTNQESPPEADLLRNLDSRLEQWRVALERIERRAQSAEAALGGDLDTVGEWIVASRRVREMLAERTRRGE